MVYFDGTFILFRQIGLKISLDFISYKSFIYYDTIPMTL